jgi:hypothetical protein
MARLLAINAARGFSGMFSSIDCSGEGWEKIKVGQTLKDKKRLMQNIKIISTH